MRGCAALLLALGVTVVAGQPDLADMAFDNAMFGQDLEEDDDDEGGFANLDDFSPPGLLNSAPPPEPLPTVPFVAPPTSGLHFVETFEEPSWDERWRKSKNEKFNGSWERNTRQIEALTGDHGLILMDEAKHHGIATRFPRIETNKGKTFILQYEVKFEENLNCGGSYLKVIDSSNLNGMEEFDNETPYLIMFGPDRCGGTNKVHFIFKIKNKISGEWSEHHLKSPPPVPHETDVTHLYTLIIKPDDSFVVEVDGAVASEGSLLEDMTPPLQVADEVDDPSDEKPSDWVDEAKIADPEAVKPEEWDENAPRKIPDPDATIPDDWLENDPKMISDPDATMPDDWDEEEDGEWEAPPIPNPRCAEVSGCGPWSPPLIPNPAFKGPWKPPMIDNPEYKGAWRRKKMANPNYYKLESPHAMYPMDGVGFELWTMQKRIVFDNIVIANDVDAVRRFTDKTWKLRNEIERSHVAEPKKDMSPRDSDSMTAQMKTITRWVITEYPVPSGAAVIVTVLMMFYMMLGRGKKRVDSVETPAESKESNEKENPKQGVNRRLNTKKNADAKD
eukprot:GHVN01058584.1.p1 GENE.GHVN01058584.1~~GHVN01058584.1.p1  ORF type:complete len:560 (+),score=103.77 GHVN01058584.1:1709-3388(+)